MPRERLERLADEAWRHRLTIVAAPAGSGKTTLLASWAAAGRDAGHRIAWYRVESTDAALPAFLAYLQLAIGEALTADPASRARGARQTWRSIEDVAAWLERHAVGQLLLIIDDYHHLAGSAAESGLARLLDLAPPGFAVVLGTRVVPTVDVSRWRLAGELLEVSGDDLRFRFWEVERLYRDHYGEVLRGDELGRLARRTEGWAAGLQFFHLATKGKSPGERARLLEALPGSARLIREYLARNVLDELPEELREFLVATCLLRRLSGPLCDRFLGTAGSAARLEELERRQVFTVSLEDGTYRYHEVLQAQLEQILTEARGEAGVRQLAARAAALLEDEGALAEALVAFCRAEQWEDAARVLGSGGDRLEPNGSARWLADVAPALIRNDPWLRLASARRYRAEGSWESSKEAFAQAESAFGASEASARCRAERLALAAFLGPDARPPSHWSGILLTGLRRDPLASGPTGWRMAAPNGHGGAGERLAIGLLDLAAGFVRDAQVTLLDVSADTEVEPAITAAATIGAGTAAVLAGDAAGSEELERGTAMAERAGENWLARLGRGVLALGTSSATAEGVAEIRAFREGAKRGCDGWGEILYALIEGWARLMRAPPADSDGGMAACAAALDAAAEASRRLGAGSLEAWSRALASRALARMGAAGARDAALRAESVSRAAGVRGALVPVYLALAESDSGRAGQHRAFAEAVGRETGLRVPDAAHDQDHGASRAERAESTDLNEDASAPDVGPGGAAAEPSLEIHLLGGFAMRVAGRPVNLATIKPRPRAILRLLALNAGQPVHREVLAETFWPDADPLTASRNVQVAISGLRRELGSGDGSESALLVRDGDAYRLAVPPGSWIDLIAAEEALSVARAARTRQDVEAEASAFRCAIDLGSRELLPEDGPAEWVIYRREELRTELANAARALAESTMTKDAAAAAEVCAVGLRLDPHHDGLWRLLIETHEHAGDFASAEAARLGYARMLDQLGVEPADG